MGILLNFVPVNTRFAPDIVAAMSEAYRKTLAALPLQPSLTRDVIARRILVRAAQGECDAHTLHLLVLASLKQDYAWRDATHPDEQPSVDRRAS
jgi:hypothetical protein